MIGGGTIGAMIASLKANKALRQRTYFRNKEDYIKASSKLKIKYVKATKEQMLLIREKIQLERKEEIKRKIKVFAVSALITSLILFCMISFIKLKL